MLSLSNVTYIYRNDTKAQDNVNLNIPMGMFGLLGPNGAGMPSRLNTPIRASRVKCEP